MDIVGLMGLNDSVEDLWLLGLMEINSSKNMRYPNIDKPWTCVRVCLLCALFVSVTKCWEMGYSQTYL